jgi:hypothetical protein
MRTAVAAALALAAGCVPSGQPLAEMTNPDVSVLVYGNEGAPGSLIVDVWSSDCQPFDERLQARAAGIELAFDPPEGLPGDSCVAAHAETLQLSTSEGIVLTMADPSAVWTIAFPGPYERPIELVGPIVGGQEATVAWPGSLPIVNGVVRLVDENEFPIFVGDVGDPGVRIDKETNTLRFTPPYAPPPKSRLFVELVTEIELYGSNGGKALPTCDGPGYCRILVDAIRYIDVVN